jgi:hypothetical protein
VPNVDHDKGTSSIYPQASRLFGTTLADSLISAYEQIGKSGMLYSPVWQEGKIRGVQCGWIPKALLLLCLHEQRFIKCGETVLSSIIRDLGATKIVRDALKEWKLEQDFENLSATSPSFLTYTRNKQACRKCEIFVARAYRCIKALKRTRVDESLMRKIKASLAIMNESCKVSTRDIEKFRAEMEAKKKKKMERLAKKPRKSEDSSDFPPSVSLESTSDIASECPSSSDQVIPPNGNGKAQRGDKKKSKKSKGRRKEREESLAALVGVFEEQYKIMGETLTVLKKKVQDHKEATVREVREEVRAELLQELIMSGYVGASSLNPLAGSKPTVDS